MRAEFETIIAKVCTELFGVDVAVELTRPDEKFGDYATNVALQLSKQIGQNPREIAEQLAVKLRENFGEHISDVSVAGPGFLNFRLSNARLCAELGGVVEAGSDYGASDRYKAQTIVVEYSDPNPFKVLHAGHLYTSVVGDAIANLFEAAGAEVHRVNFGGDVGMHVGKTLWAIVKRLGGEDPEKLAEVPVERRSEWMAEAYVEGNNAYDDDEAVKAEMVAMNKKVYDFHEQNAVSYTHLTLPTNREV